uniref:Uncharacterized protein n=1 Tax=viral metagenome TaxID=1070528 RepID=A0A6C0LDU1_9ZZZZ
MNCIGRLHLCGMIMENVYGYFIKQHDLFDTLYIMSFVSIPFSWVLCKDECIISYITKKIENPNYQLGDEPENVKDVSSLFVNEKQYMTFYNINVFLRVGSALLVNNRTTKINAHIFIPTCLMYMLYNYDITYNLNHRKKLYPYFQLVLLSYLLESFYYCIF